MATATALAGHASPTGQHVAIPTALAGHPGPSGQVVAANSMAFHPGPSGQRMLTSRSLPSGFDSR